MFSANVDGTPIPDSHSPIGMVKTWKAGSGLGMLRGTNNVEVPFVAFRDYLKRSTGSECRGRTRDGVYAAVGKCLDES